MKNNVYVRNNKSIMSISITRMLCILPMIIYGLYKNGIFLYKDGYVDIFKMFRPFIFIFGSVLVGMLVNIIYEYLIKKNKDDIISVIFSSFHVEYALLLSCIISINTNMLIYFSVLVVMLFISKFLNNRVNIMCLIFIIIYAICISLGDYNFLNIYESSKEFSLEFMDYLIGRSSGGIASTHIIFLILALFGLSITNNNKTSITLSSIITFSLFIVIFCIIKNVNFIEILFANNYIFIFSLIATDSVTTCYTPKGMLVFGILVGIITFGLYFLNPILAPFIAILIVSLFNNLIDRKAHIFFKNK